LVVDDAELGMMAHSAPWERRSAAGATVHLGGQHASHLVVPVVPADAQD
jgi:uncharacterized protein